MKLTPDSKFMQLCGKFVALFKINFLWLLCSVPLVTLGASTCAMLTALTALRREEDCGAKAFFGAFRRYFGKATVLWLLMAFAPGLCWLWTTGSWPIWISRAVWR